MSHGRLNALWGRGGRRASAFAATLLCALGAATAATAAPVAQSHGAYVQQSLADAAAQNATQSFDVLVESTGKVVGAGFLKQSGLSPSDLRRTFTSVDAAEMTLTGVQIAALAQAKWVSAIVPNDAVEASSVTLPRWNTQEWAWVSHAPVDWTAGSLALNAPTIAVVDSGIDAGRSDFGGRVVGQASFVSSGSNSPGDGYGHGTFVAGIAAGAADGLAGVAPNADLVSLDVMNDAGVASVADVLAACDWILANKGAYNIRVANFSLHSASPASVFFDPLDQAVERLWLNGVVVVAASGNYASNGVESGVPFAPANDPFVITVGASDINSTVSTADDTVAPFSAWGYTPDGFAKPDLVAPGRYLIGPVPAGSTLTQERPDHVLPGATMQLSGTSFAAPEVAATAAMILARHPGWTPDQVKGALVDTAQAMPAATPRSVGAGELDVAAARRDASPSNPNAGVDQFVTPSGTFGTAAWESAALASVAWGDAAWGDVAWSDAAWATVAWGDVAWSDVAWGDVAWGDVAWSDSVKDSLQPGWATTVSNGDVAQVEHLLGIGDTVTDPTASP
ncbi:MAG TPA: S8 family serine peptidase [Gaiellaceae bacterium]